MVYSDRSENPELPETPAISETLPGFVHADWFAVVAPPKTPAAITEKLAGGIRQAFQSPEAAKILRDLKSSPVLNSPAEAREYIQADSTRWRDIIDANHITAD